MLKRTILCKVSCTGGGGSCCGSKKPAIKYSILTIEQDDPDGCWEITSFTRPTGNYMKMSQQYRKLHASTYKRGVPTWKGTVYGMELHKDEDFMVKLKAKVMKTLKGKCKVAKDDE